MLETVFSAFLCIVSAFIFYSSTQFNMAFIGNSGLGPDFFPKVIAVILFMLSAMLFVGSIKNKDKKSIYNPNMKYTFMVIFTFAVYIFLIDRIGYLVSTVIFAFVVITILKSKSKILNIIFAIAFPIALYLLFTYAFKVSLPTGLFI
ncbi:tripartite tricarboxylate transporter TctB family protein [Fusobacterium ulcerans]|uniref:tripartite tricarboxylate transporter TctB family protein n=1 Tax=Fusobacterium ulcerans TaxID=861 RepID=UPI001D0B386C|nr:tripartite tricarboxylate transporter TctB family protein [Fusobacterium ulcerans]MCB8566270.1 tripartite tricarboxylate transporter TctB family protein [Fusobacterium ulcerans]MCB8650262.1 tripartite tricarboxylate transporter TctB family protein [Fusobacterium ulcerans]